MPPPLRNRLLLIAAVLLGLGRAVAAAEVVVLSGGAVEPGLKPALASFQAATGHTARMTFNPAPEIARRIEGGEVWDVVIAPVAVLDGFVRSGKVGTERVGVGRVGLGVAVRPDTPLPTIGDAESVKRAILEADSIVYNRASTGLLVEAMLRKMGIEEQVAAKAKRFPDGASVMEHLLHGVGREIGFGAMTEILLFRDRGLRLVGPLPPGLQVYTAYAAALPTAGSRSEAARRLLEHLASPAAQRAFAGAGIDPAP
jgi:molybdate transport system substrate-binding protein